MSSELVVSITVQPLLKSMEEKGEKRRRKINGFSKLLGYTNLRPHKSVIPRLCEHPAVLHAFVPIESFRLHSEKTNSNDTNGARAKSCFQ